MLEYKLSNHATADLIRIADYTVQNFGIVQSRMYRDYLHSCFNDLAIDPYIGRIAKNLSKHKLMRYRFKSHVIFYTPTNTGVFIVRVLGGRMDFGRHL